MFRNAASNRRWLGLAGSVVLLMLVVVAGCGRSQPPARDVKLTETGRLSALVGDVADAMENSQRFESLFAEGAAPEAEDRAEYGPPMRFVLVGNPEISDDTATLTVNVVKVDETTEEEEVVREVKWTAVRQGENWWLLKTAPLR